MATERKLISERPVERWKQTFQRLWNIFIHQRWINLGLRGKMAFMVEVGVIGLTMVFLLIGVSTARQTTLSILNERMLVARLSAAALDTTLLHVRSILEITLANPVIGDSEADPAEVRTALETAFDQIALAADGVYLIDHRGRVIAMVGNDHLNLDWGTVHTEGAWLQPAVHVIAQDETRVVIVSPGSASSENKGYLAAVLDFDSSDLAPFKGSVDLGTTGAIELVDAGGRVLASSATNRPEAASSGSLKRFFVDGEPSVETCVGCGGTESIDSGGEVVAFAPLGQAKWGVVVRQQSSELMAPVNRLLLQALILGIITIVGAMLLVWVTTNSVIKPVQKLTEAARRITAGDLSTPMEALVSDWFPSRRPRQDEIGALAEGFETMRRQLKHSLDETQALNRELDQRVRERTESLMLRNQQLSILNAIATTVNQSLKLEEILDRALDAVLNLTEVDMGAVFLFEEVQGALQLMAYRGMSPEAAQIAANMGLLDSSCGGIIEHGRVVIVPDISHYKGLRARSLQREGINTLVHVPLTAKGCVLGSMCVATREERDFDTAEQDLLKAIGSQLAIAIENARLYAEVQQKERNRGELFKKAINAQEDERKRIARELHDETSQFLTALLFAAEEAGELKSIAAIRKRIAGMHELIQHTLDGIHKLIFDLRPSVLDHLGLAPAIRWLGKSRLEARGVRVTVEACGETKRLPAELETALFRVLQEAITNIARHSAARNVWIVYRVTDQQVQVNVQDDGVGFDMLDIEITPDSPRGLGLMGMQERLELLGGELNILSTPGSGTQLDISIPLIADGTLNG